jgi:creatinine amidohydrolase/Fe(II)-dependent formamide hydrolase-like protein
VSRRYAELSSREVAAHLGTQGLVILPVGSIEAHGASLPCGTDGLIAQAFAEELSRKAPALVLPMVPYGYCPTTKNLPATLSVSAESLLAYLKSLLAALIRQGARKILILGIHKENASCIAPAVQDLGVESGRFILYVNPYYCYAEELDNRILGDVDNSYKEHALLMASLSILGAKPSMLKIAADDYLIRKPTGVSRLRKVGILGYHYARETEHIAPRANVSVDAGLLYIAEVVERLAGLLRDWHWA